MRSIAPRMRAVGPPAAAALLLIGICILRFAQPDVDGLMLFAVVPITLLGMMLGLRAGVIAAVFASAVSLVWAATKGHPALLDWINEPVTFLVLGGISGYYARGALGDFDWRQAAICGELRRALDRHQVELHYQPIVRDGRAPLAVEGLARWRHPKRGLVSPADFIPAAESDQSTIWGLTMYTLELAINDMAGMEDDDLAVAINLSPAILQRGDLPSAIGEILERTGFPAHRLAIEVTETGLSGGYQAAAEVLAGIKQLGVGMVAIDDFGVGESSLARLAHLPIDALKIDRALVLDLDNDQTQVIVRGIAELGHRIGLTVIAEGVETHSSGAWLMEQRCDALQGFHFSAAMPPAELPKWLEAHAAPSLT